MGNFVPFDEIREMLRHKTEGEVVEEVGTRKFAPGLTVQDYFTVLKFYRRAGRLASARRNSPAGWSNRWIS